MGQGMMRKMRINVYLLLTIVLLLCLTACKKEPALQEYLDLGQKYLEEMKYEEAIVAFTEAIEIETKNLYAYQGLSAAYHGAGEYQKAIDTMETGFTLAQQLDSSVEEMKQKLLALYEEQGNMAVESGEESKILSVYTRIKELDPQSIESYLIIADIYMNREEYLRAIEVLKEGIENTGSDTLIQKREELEMLLESLDLNQQESEETQADELTTGAEEHDSAGSLEGSNYKINVLTDRKAVISLDDPNLQSSYVTNKAGSRENALEYVWKVLFSDGAVKFEVSTSQWAFDPGREEMKSVVEMQHSLWIFTESGGANRVNDVTMELEGTTLNWVVEIPETYDFSFYSLESSASEIKDNDL